MHVALTVPQQPCWTSVCRLLASLPHVQHVKDSRKPIRLYLHGFAAADSPDDGVSVLSMPSFPDPKVVASLSCGTGGVSYASLDGCPSDAVSVDMVIREIKDPHPCSEPSPIVANDEDLECARFGAHAHSCL